MGGLLVLALIGGLGIFVSCIWTLIIAFRESTSCGLLSIFVPFYGLYYAITRWAQTKKPFLIGLIGVPLLVVGILVPVMQFKGEVEPVVREFMEAAAVKDVDRAYACRPSEEFTKEEIADFIEANYHSLFAEYEGLSTSGWYIESGCPGGTTGSISGDIAYTDGTELPFEATLVKKNGAWKLVGFYIGR